ncbi:MAG: phosphoenolpyruvate--protein phosphotransferase [Pseudomonadota bacterium]
MSTQPSANRSAPRALIRQLHGLMAERGDAEAKLRFVVHEIAGKMRTEVCSIYILSAPRELELFATQGLAQSAVHQTRMRFGEGLVGHIAERRVPLNLPDAKANPLFSYRPETEEDVYQSFLGVPIIRSGIVLGVLSIQTFDQRRFHSEEVEALQTVAMVLAELLTQTGLIDIGQARKGLSRSTEATTLRGLALVDGVAQGAAVFHQPQVEIDHMVAEDIEHERERVTDAFRKMRAQIDRIMAASDIGHTGEHRDILETYKMFAFDEGWVARINQAIDTGLTAEAAIDRVQQRTRNSMQKTKDPYLLERLHDLDDLANRLLRIVSGKEGSAAAEGLNEDSIVFARTMGPAELLEYDRRYLKGVVLYEGSPTAHVTIVARAMGVPMLGRIRIPDGVLQAGDQAVLDAESGQVILRPAAEVLSSYAQIVEMRDRRAEQYAALRETPTVTRDGVPIELMINAGLKADLPNLAATGASGIGLFRTEFQFMVSSELPRIDAQVAFYREVFEAAAGQEILFRTIDVGGDKHLPYLEKTDEENPAMGWRAVRVALERPVLLRMQVRALLRAANGRPLSIMFPMVAEVAEFDAARALVDRELVTHEKLGGTLPSELNVGVMLEVPSLAWQLEQLLPRIDFLSIGSNDLFQFFFAADRSNPKLANHYDLLSAGPLTFIHSIISACAEKSVRLSLCGEVGGRPLEAMALIGLGLKRLSISPSAVGAVRLMVLGIDYQDLSNFMKSLMNSPAHSVRDDLMSYAEEHGIHI